MAFHAATLANLKSGVGTFSNLISASPKQKYGYTPMSTAITLKPKETLYFTIENENSISFESDVTDHYVENNEAIQDHVALRPVIITTSAFVGEVTTKIDGALGELDNLVQEKLTQVSQYLPKVTATATQLINTAKQAISTAKKAKDAIGSAWDKINGKGGEDKKTKQQAIFEQFRTYWKERTLFVVNTPWAQYDNCIIQSFKVSQSGDTENISTFDVTFKQLRFVNAYAKKSIRAGRNATQAGGIKNLGSSTPTDSATTWKDSVSKYASSLWDSAKSAWG